MKTHFILTCVLALALGLTLGPALPASAAFTADTDRTPVVVDWLTDGLSYLGTVLGQLRPERIGIGNDAADGTDDQEVLVLDGDGEKLRPERIGIGLAAVPE